MCCSIYILAKALLLLSLGYAGGFHAAVVPTCHKSASSIYISCNDADDVSNEDAEKCRRDVLQTIAKVSLLPVATIIPTLASAADDVISSTSIIAAKTIDTISVPLEYIPTLSAYVVHYNLFGERFGAILDTGSPFLTAPATCSTWSYKYKWGCYHPEKTYDSGLSNTIEGFDNNQGLVVWRKAEFTFDDQLQQPRNLTFGVFGPQLLDGPGGVFFGLIKNTDSWIRPSFLGQTGYKSFTIDLRQKPQLVMSKESMIDGDDWIPLEIMKTSCNS